jgi:hypothetical protein
VRKREIDSQRINTASASPQNNRRIETQAAFAKAKDKRRRVTDTDRPIDRSIDRPIDQSRDRSTKGKSIGQSTDRSIDRIKPRSRSIDDR